MKKILFTSIFAGCAAIGLSSCMNGDYDANPAGTLNGNNPLKTERMTGGNGTIRAHPAIIPGSGSDPVSAKINGTSFQATSASAVDAAGSILVQGTNGTTTIQISFANETPPNTVLLITPGVTTATGAVLDGNAVFSAGSGKGGGIYVMENDATHCAGRFFINVTDPNGSGATRDVTEGYFNVTK